VSYLLFFSSNHTVDLIEGGDHPPLAERKGRVVFVTV